MKKLRLNETATFLLTGSLLYAGALSAQISGELDENFGTMGYVLTDHVASIGEVYNDLVVLSNDKILMVGYVNDAANTDLLIARYEKDGSLDATFGAGGKVIIDMTIGADEQATAAVELFDGKILVTGGVDNGTIDAFILRLNEDGSIDNSFGTGGTGHTYLNAGANLLAFGSDVEVDGSNTIYVAATVANSLGDYDFAVFKLTQGGGVDASFGNSGVALVDNGGATDFVFNMDVSSATGKILMTGYTEDASIQGFVTRLNSNGSLDLTFNASGGYIYDGTPDDNILYDACFVAGDQILAVGSAGTGDNLDGIILRLSDDGTLDNTFGTNGVVISDIGSANGVFLRRVQVSEHGKIFAGGHINGLNLRTPYVISLDADGGADADFSQGGDAAPEFAISLNDIQGTGMGIQSDGNVLLGGSITSQDFVGENMYLVRLYGIEAELGIEDASEVGLTLYPNPAQNEFYIQTEGTIEHLSLVDVNGKQIDSWDVADHYALKPHVVSGTYFLHITTTNGNTVRKLQVIR